MSEDTTNGMKERVLARIERREVVMIPRLIVLLKALALAVLVLLALAVAVFLLNFLFFFLRINGPFFFTPFDMVRLLAFFPWTLLALDVGLLLLAEVLLQQFRFVYRRPVLFSAFALIALTISFGLAIDRATHFNERMESGARIGRLPSPIGELYRHARHF